MSQVRPGGARLSAQHLNLLDASLLPPKTRYGASLGLALLALMLLVMGGSGWALRHAAARQAAEAAALQQALPALQAQLGAPLQSDDASRRQQAELAALRRHDAALQQLVQALEGGRAGRSQGYADYLLALARQSDRLRQAGAEGSLWIVGLQIDSDNGRLQLQGRMTEPALLPGYLRGLNEEPLFRGHRFGSLSVKTLDQAQLREFSLQAETDASQSRGGQPR